jgi:AcrR family transcriptional regulator
MKESSQNEPRRPQRQRGYARSQALLAAAGEVFAEKGYEAATMTEIAQRAGSAIGSLYQFFPTKAALAQKLMADQINVLTARLEALRQEAPQLRVEELSGRLTRTLVDFRADHPSFARLVDTPGAPPEFVSATRQGVRDHVGAVLGALWKMTPTEHEAVAWTVQQVMKAAVALQTEALSARQRRRAMDELTAMLASYLRGRASSA